MVEKEKAIRISGYLKGDDILLFKAIIEEINHQRRVDCDNYFKRTGFAKEYKSIGSSELIVQLLKRFQSTSKQSYIQELDYHSKQAEFYEEKIRKMNILKKEELLKNEIRA